MGMVGLKVALVASTLGSAPVPVTATSRLFDLDLSRIRHAVTMAFVGRAGGAHPVELKPRWRTRRRHSVLTAGGLRLPEARLGRRVEVQEPIMPETLEERVADLEQMVLRQSEKMAALEDKLEIAQRVLTTRMLRAVGVPKDEAA